MQPRTPKTEPDGTAWPSDGRAALIQLKAQWPQQSRLRLAMIVDPDKWDSGLGTTRVEPSINMPGTFPSTHLNQGSRLVAVFTALSATICTTEADIVITIDKSAQTMSVAVNGEERHSWPISTGRPGYSTPTGSFTAFRMAKEYYSKQWDDSPMPHSIFFTQRGHAIHGSLRTRRLGHPASHGCVRLAPANAETLFNLVKADGLSTTKVVITGEDKAIPAVAKRSGTARESSRHTAKRVRVAEARVRHNKLSRRTEKRVRVVAQRPRRARESIQYEPVYPAWPVYGGYGSSSW